MKHLQAWLLFIVLFAFRLIFVISGLFIVPIAYIMRKGERFRKPFWLWSNDEDGIFGPHWFNKGVKNFKTCYLWSAIRNPANNMRYIGLFNVDHAEPFEHIIRGDRTWDVSAKTSRQLRRPVWHYTLVKQGGLWYPSYWYIRTRADHTHFRFRIGWKCTPQWIEEPRAAAYRQAGMTIQFIPLRKG